GGEGALLPTGQAITPQAAPGAVFQDLDPKVAARPDFRAGQAVAIAPSPDGSQGLVLTSGYNRAAGARDEYVFRYDLTRSTPRLRQVVTVPNSFQGIAWAPDGESFEVSGGVDDVIHSFRREKEEFVEIQPPIALRHSKGVGLEVSPLAAGLAISPDGRRLLVTNFQNDSVSLVDLDHRLVLDEHDLRPGNGIGGGEFPLSVVWRDAGTAYVASQRDRELIVLTLAADRITVRERIKLEGVPTALLLDQRTKRLFVACDNSDTVRVIDTATDQVAFDLGAGIPSRLFPNPRGLKGAGPNGLALSPEGETLYVTLGGLNALAVIPVKAGAQPVGLIPTGWYPTGVAVSGDGERLFVINGKSPTGPNPGACRDTLALATDALQGCLARERYVWQLEKAGLLSLPRPPAATLAALTRQVAINDHIDARAAVPRLGWLAAKVKHVIYVVKENRSYDQVLGDLEIGDGDPELTLFPEALTPNHHRLARAFVTVDNFFDSGEVSSNGWLWSTAARSTDFIEKETPVHYAGRGLQYDSEGLNRNIDVGLPPEERRAVNPAIPDDPDLLPGTGDVAAPAGGYLWDAARQAGVSVRNYGFYGDLTLYDGLGAKPAPLERMPFRRRVPVFQATKPALADVTDPYFRGFDMRFPDFWRVREWQRDFADLVRRHAVPRLMLVRLPHDHFGSFNEAIDGVDTVETQIADNDYAVGTLVETIAKSPIRDETVIFIVEDDAQNGADHVDA
ncbi:MAG TPA: phosphoesterase, partial [Stellaceae bacterium]|nr:phosphoesterase [Stellaceae bacterium]